MKETTPQNDVITLERSVINITSRCTLRCKLCVMGCPYYETPPHYSLDIIEKTIDRYFAVVNSVKMIEFSGGEPFIHSELPKMIDKVMTYQDRFERLLVFTNATIYPKNELRDAIIRSKNKISIYISHYGELSKQADALVDFLNENEISYKLFKYYGNSQHFDGWVDYGSFEKRNRKEQELKSIFLSCGATKMSGCFTTHGGQMHWCVPSARGMKIQKEIPDSPSDYIDLFDESLTIEQQRQKIRVLQNKRYITACDHCSGDHGTSDPEKRFPAAEQL